MIDSPCNGCKRRKLGCHNVETCAAWREYVEKTQERRARAAERYQEGSDWERHIRRHGRGKEVIQK